MIPVVVWELDEERLAKAETDFPGIEIYNSVARMLTVSDVNLNTIAMPHTTEANLTLQHLKAGKSVWCEKSLAITTAKYDAMISEAKKRRLVLTTYHSRQ